MTQILSIWSALDARKRMIVALATVAMMAAVFGIARMAATPDMSLLYAGLDPASAGEVISQLEQQNIPFEVRAGAIYVSTQMRDQTRLTLAAQGLPASGTAGYELLDSLTGFGTTSQMFDAAYWRAKEGELARTIVAAPDIRAARVHIANPVRNSFQRGQAGSASVTITTAQGRLDGSRAEALRYLVASAVAGLAPEDISVIDANSGTVMPMAGGDGIGISADAQNARSAAMKANIERLLAARVGAGKAVVEVMIDADMDSQTITERVIDPTSRVAISSDSEERSETEQGTGNGAVTVASNLPDGDAQADGGSSSRSNSITKERLNFEVSETRRERVIQPGQIRRISVAVIVDGLTEVSADGVREWSPRPAEELEALTRLVESAIGFDQARGDVVTLQSMEFPQAGDGAGTIVGVDGPSVASRLVAYVPLLILSLVAIVLGLFVLRPILSQPPALPSEDILEGEAHEIVNQPTRMNDAAPVLSDGPKPEASKINNLKNLINERETDSRDVLRRWIEAPDTQPEKA